ncbi:hypothetical protein [Methylobacterium nonmethylotrophicum]|uniref:Uncharacterized protein n=1 Tax=Methylobacterium nonmethylotrophicum TaxID=1141884 RepID=A0A4Z0NNT7_9HYPH|nr:hypothetical protein [Methylobacterium nonmethylotrophicum]TGD97684.1 hypothetical protein EU555_18780 [Methylobacterium nonmethylotrophicum]
MMPIADLTGMLHPRTARMPSDIVRPQEAYRAVVTVDDGYRYRTIGSAMALLIAVAASLLVTGLLRIVL